MRAPFCFPTFSEVLKMKKNLIALTVLSLGLTFGLGYLNTEANASSPKNESVVYHKAANTDYMTITIKKGDTLYSLSKKYHTTVAALQKLNNLKSSKIIAGKKLKVPNDVKTAGKITMKLQKGYLLEEEEPGKTILLYKNDTTYFARIEILDPNAKIVDIQKEATEYLKSTGKVQVMNPNQAHKFYKGAILYLHASNSQVSQNLVVKKIDGKLVKFTIHFANKESSEGITPYMMDMLTTIKIK